MITTIFSLGDAWVWLLGVVLLVCGGMIRMQARSVLTDGMHNRIVMKGMPWLIERPNFQFSWWVLMGVYMFLLAIATVQYFALAAVVLKNSYWALVVVLVLRTKRERKASWRWR